MKKLFNIASPGLGIDLGTTNTLVYVEDKGIVINEPSIVAVDTNTGEILAVGQKAYEMVGKTPANIVAMKALENGVISDYEVTQEMLKYFFNKAIASYSLLSPKIIVSVPYGITDVEKRAVEDACMQTGARDVLTVEESIASCAGMGLDAFEPAGNMVVNIGGGTTEIAVVSLGGIVACKTLFIGGDRFNKVIISYAKDEKDIMIGDKTAEEVKLSIATVDIRKEDVRQIVNGRDMITGLPTKAELSSKEIAKRLEPIFFEIIDGIKSVLERTPPELASDIMRDGIHLTGGSSRLDGVYEFLREYTRLPFVKDDEPIESACKGAGIMIKRFSKLKKSKRNNR